MNYILLMANKHVNIIKKIIFYSFFEKFIENQNIFSIVY